MRYFIEMTKDAYRKEPEGRWNIPLSNDLFSVLAVLPVKRSRNFYLHGDFEVISAAPRDFSAQADETMTPRVKNSTHYTCCL